MGAARSISLRIAGLSATSREQRRRPGTSAASRQTSHSFEPRSKGTRQRDRVGDMFGAIPKRNSSTAPGVAPWFGAPAPERDAAQKLRGSELGGSGTRRAPRAVMENTSSPTVAQMVLEDPA